MSLLKKRSVILGKIESAYGTDPTPDATNNSIMCEEPAWSHAGTRMTARNPVRGNLSPLKSLYGGHLLQIVIKCEVRGAGAAYAAGVRPEIDVLLRACGFSSTVDATPGSELVTYVPVSSSHESVTLYFYEDGTLLKLTGGRGNVSFSMEAGQPVYATFTITGHASTMTDVSLVTPAFDATIAPPFLSAAFAAHSYSAVISSLSIDAGNQVAMPPSANAADGYGEIRLTGRDFGGSFDPEKVVVATHNPVAIFKAGTAASIAAGPIGATQYNKFTLTMPAAYYAEVGPGDRDGIATYAIGYKAVGSSGDDDLSIVFS